MLIRAFGQYWNPDIVDWGKKGPNNKGRLLGDVKFSDGQTLPIDFWEAKGIYVLFEGKDKKITGNYKEDFSDMYNADVFEVFFHPEPATPLYFEYEINAYDKELVLLIPNLDGKIMGWRPWHYETSRLIKHKVKVQSKSGAMASWSAELFFPYTLLAPLQKVPPGSGMHWNANFCRLDYDPGKMVKWSWSPVQTSFHEFKQFRTIRFE